LSHRKIKRPAELDWAEKRGCLVHYLLSGGKGRSRTYPLHGARKLNRRENRGPKRKKWANRGKKTCREGGRCSSNINGEESIGLHHAPEGGKKMKNRIGIRRGQVVRKPAHGRDQKMDASRLHWEKKGRLLSRSSGKALG